MKNGTKKLNEVQREKKGRRYNEDFIFAVLRDLQACHYDCGAISKKHNLSYATVQRWRDRYPEATMNKPSLKVTDRIDIALAEEKLTAIEYQGKLLQLAYKKAEELIPQQKNLSQITDFIKVISSLGIGDPGFKNQSLAREAIENTLGKLASLNSSIDDVPFEPVN